MARIAYEDDFKDKIIGATKKTIGIGALAFALAGCQATPNNNLEVENLTNNTKVEAPVFESKIAAAAAKLDTINASNYKEIILDRKSGIYRHPIYPDQISTIMFTDDPDSVETIKNQMNELDLDPVWFDREKLLLEVAKPGSSVSRHVQNPFGSDNEDINLSRIKIAGKNDAPLLELDSSVLNDHSKIPEDFTIDKLNDFLHKRFHLIRHEEGHSKIGQQMSILDFVKGIVDLDVYAFLENDTETYAMIETAKLMNEEGYSHSQILENAHYSVRSSSGDVKNDDKRESNDYHLYHSSVKMIYEMIENDLDYIVNLSALESDRLTTILAEEAIDMNYAEELNHIELEFAKNAYTIDFIRERTKNSDVDRYIKSLENFMKGDEFKNAEKGVQKNTENQMIAYRTISEIMKNEEAANPDRNDKFSYDIYLMQSEIINNIKDNQLDSMKLKDHDKSILKINDYSRLFNKVVERLDKEGIPTPDKTKIIMDMRGELEESELTQMAEIKQDNKQKLKM